MAGELRAQVWAKTDGRCWYCGKLMNPWNDFTIEHQIPRSQGGSDELTNLVPACESCNSQKHAKTVEEFKLYLLKKQTIRFWGEHAVSPPAVEALTQDVGEEDEDYASPDAEEYIDIIHACFAMGRLHESNLAMTLIALVASGFEWRRGEDSGHECSGWFDISSIARTTGCSMTTVLSHIQCLLEHDFLTMSWQSGPYESHEFTLSIGAMLILAGEL